MKTVLTIFILLAFILFSSSVIARELAQSGTDQTGNHNNPNDPKGPIIKCDPRSPSYESCVARAKQEPKAKCDPKSIYASSRCTGTGTSPTGKKNPGNHNNPVNPPVKPGTGAGGGGTGNHNNKPTPACNPRGPYNKCTGTKPQPKHKCVPSNIRSCPPEDP